VDLKKAAVPATSIKLSSGAGLGVVAFQFRLVRPEIYHPRLNKHKHGVRIAHQTLFAGINAVQNMLP
jgi:hypothetical protein